MFTRRWHRAQGHTDLITLVKTAMFCPWAVQSTVHWWWC